MKKTMLCALLCVMMLLSACSTTTYPVMEPVALDGLTLTQGESDTLTAQYNADEWYFDTSMAPVDFAIFDKTDISAQTNVLNVNAILIGEYGGKLTQKFLDGLLEAVKTTAGAEGVKIELSEMRNFENEPVCYIETHSEFTEGMADAYIENSGITEDQLEALGGREALLSIPPTNQVQIYAVIDGQMLIFTGTYYDEADKARMLDAMNVLMQTMEVK